MNNFELTIYPIDSDIIIAITLSISKRLQQ